MSVTSYDISLLRFNDCLLQIKPEDMFTLLKYWRSGYSTGNICTKCHKKIIFKDRNFTFCCGKFYYAPTANYIVNSLAIPTPGYEFMLPNLKKTLRKNNMLINQEFLVLPDPIYWQIPTSLVYEKTMKLVTKSPMTKKTTQILPSSKSSLFYKQIQEAPLNHGSLFRRSGGKNTFFRQIAFGKRCVLSMRAMIVPDSSLRPNEIVLPTKVDKLFSVLNKWIILNRMPSLQPENFVALRVTRTWDNNCFGIPLEIVELMNADFDGDECNLYLVPNIQSQAECMMVLNSESEMGSFTNGIKINPCQDMLVIYKAFYDEIDFLPYKNPNLRKTFRVIYDLYGSKTTFDCVDAMRRYYLHTLHDRFIFAVNLDEIRWLIEKAEGKTFDEFRSILERENPTQSCLVAQVKAAAKGSFYHLYQMFGSIGDNGENSFWKGLSPSEAVSHAVTSFDALWKAGKIWEPGYGYSKCVYNLQSIHVDYLGRLRDNDLIVEGDVIDALHHTDLLCEDSFSELIKETLTNSSS